MAISTTVSDQGSPTAAYVQAYFVTIATILGTGILGLPVTLTKSGLYPFLISFLLDAVMQSVLIHFFVDLLQHACAIQLQNQKEDSVPLNSMAEEEVALDSDDNADTPVKSTKLPAVQGRTAQSPNLHLLGKLFLGCGIRQMFDALIILQFIALLICYALAGSEAFAELLGIKHYYVIPVFVWVLTLAIVFGLQLIQPIISVLTFIKGSVLLATTCVTFFVGMKVGRTISNDFSYIGAPFLMGTVALGGTINTMPFTFEKIRYKKEEVTNYRLAVQLGLWTCVLLNILWCWSVLDIVPQTVAMACEETYRLQSADNSTVHGSKGLCFGELSLESAKLNGEISTLPMTQVLARDHPRFMWVAILVQLFIMVSITVSYLTIGGALHHTLTGVVHSILVSKGDHPDERTTAPQTYCSKLKMLSVLVSLLAFILVFVVAMSDPQGFESILERFASLTMNSQAGIFVFLMLLASRKVQGADIPAPMSSWFQKLLWTIPIFFNAAVVMDVYNTIRDWLHPVKLLPIVMTNSTLHGNPPVEVVVGGN